MFAEAGRWFGKFAKEGHMALIICSSWRTWIETDQVQSQRSLQTVWFQQAYLICALRTSKGLNPEPEHRKDDPTRGTISSAHPSLHKMIHPPTDDREITEPEPKTTPVQDRKRDMQSRPNRTVKGDDKGDECMA